MPQDLTKDKSALVQVMAWCSQPASHYPNQYWQSSVTSYGITRPQWVNYREASRVEGVPLHDIEFGLLQHECIIAFWEFIIKSSRPSDVYMRQRIWSTVVQIIVCRLVGAKPLSEVLNQCWNIVDLNLRNRLQWNLKRISYIFIQANAFENAVWEMVAILSWPQCVDWSLLNQVALGYVQAPCIEGSLPNMTWYRF